jgi:glutamate--cysteine ligase
VALFEWGGQVLAECEPIAAALDAAHGTRLYGEALAGALAALADPASVPSARILREMRSRFDGAHLRFGLEHSAQHRRALGALPFAAGVAQRFARLAEESVAEQRRVEAADDVSFETYRQRYLAPEQLVA